MMSVSRVSSFKHRRIAEAFLRVVAGFVRRHARGNVVRDTHFNVRAQLLVEFIVQFFSSQRVAQPRIPHPHLPFRTDLGSGNSGILQDLRDSLRQTCPILFFFRKLFAAQPRLGW